MTYRHMPRLFFLMVAVLLVVAACGGGDDEAAPAVTAPPAATATAPTAVPTPAPTPTATPVPLPQGEMTIALTSLGGKVMIPDQGGGVESSLQPIYDPIIASTFDGKLDATRGFATSWTASPDSKVWTFKVKDNVAFHDGVKATSADLKYVLEYSMAAGSKSSKLGPFKDNIVSMETPDASTFVLTLKNTDIFWHVSNWSLLGGARKPAFLIPKHYVSTAGLEGVNRQPVGSGPYKHKSITADKVVYDALDKHWFFAVPRTKTVTFWEVPEESTITALLRNKEVDVSGPLSVGQVKTLRDAGLRVMAQQDTRAFTYIFREAFVESYPGYGKNPLNDLRVRQALHYYAIDRKAIVETFMQGLASPTMDYPVLPQEVSWTGPLPVPAFDVAKAKAMIADAGFPNGFEMDYIIFSNLTGLDQEINEAIAVMWGKVGVKINRTPKTEQNYRDQMYANVGKSYFTKPTVAGSYSIATGTVANTFSTIPHTLNGPWIYNKDPKGIELAAAWASSPNLDEYKKRAEAYRRWEYENVSSFEPVFLTGTIWAAGSKVPAAWNPGQDPSSQKMDYLAAMR